MRIAHLADDEKPTTTACGLAWEEWQDPRSMKDDESPTRSELVAEGLLTLAEAEADRQREVDMASGPVDQCQACLKAAIR